MSDIPKVDTSSWRLPPKRHVVPEKSFTEDMYAKVGLPSDHKEHPSTGETGAPVLDTSSWTLPKKGAPALEEEAPLPLSPARSQEDPVDVKRLRRLAGLEASPRYPHQLGQPQRRLPEAFAPGEVEAYGGKVLCEEVSVPSARAPRDQRRLAGLEGRSSYPVPVHTGGMLHSRGPSTGILDEGREDGEAYVQRVLRESKWALGDFGVNLGLHRMGEAPGGRGDPWSGSDDEPAATPIVRKGQVHGVVGKHKSPEAKGAVDVGKSEIDYDLDPDDDDADEEPEMEEATRIGSLLRHVGRKAKAAGSALSHGRTSQRARSGLHHHLRKLAKKHGIDPSRFHPGYEPHKPLEAKEPEKKLSAPAAKEPEKKVRKPRAKKAKSPEKPKVSEGVFSVSDRFRLEDAACFRSMY